MRRVRRKNTDLHAQWRPAEATQEQYALFRRYIDVRHQGGEMSEMSWEDYRSMIEDAPVRTSVVEWRGSDGQLVAGMLIDRLNDGVSAVYSFFEPDDRRRGLGTYLVLDAIAGCREEGLDYLYLGYWVAESPKMAYKIRFSPMEALGPTGWSPVPAQARA